MAQNYASLIQQTRAFGNGLRQSTAVRQTSYLYASQTIGLALGFLISLINTRKLGPAEYGLYAATFAAAEFVTLFMDFGFFSSGARVLALKGKSPELQRRLIGALILVALLLSFLATMLLWTLSFFSVQLLHAEIQHVLRYFCLFLGLLTLQSFIESTCRGTNRIEALSLYYLSSRGFGLLLMAGLIATGTYDLQLAIATSLLGSVLAAFMAISSFRPVFADVGSSLRELRVDVRSYGFKAYTGDIAATASYRTDSLLVSYFVDTTGVGYYRLATLLINPMITFSRSLSTTLFRRFADSRRIAPRILKLNAGWLLFCLFGLVAAGGPLVRLLFGTRYEPVVGLLPVMAAVGLLSGLAQPMNMFLGAHGKGTYLRSAAFVLTACNLLFNLILIPLYGTLGACYASALALLVNVFLHLHYYRETVRSNA